MDSVFISMKKQYSKVRILYNMCNIFLVLGIILLFIERFQRIDILSLIIALGCSLLGSYFEKKLIRDIDEYVIANDISNNLMRNKFILLGKNNPVKALKKKDLNQFNNALKSIYK